MEKKFDVKKLEKLDNPMRRKLLPPAEILDRIGIRSGDKFADIGCGIGYFSIPASEIVGDRGLVIAMDISQTMLDYLMEHGGDKKNISPVKSGENTLPLNDGEVDIAFMCNVVHELDNREMFFKEVKRIVRGSGKLAIVDFEKKTGSFGPPLEHRVGKEVVVEELQREGLSVEACENISGEFYFICARRV